MSLMYPLSLDGGVVVRDNKHVLKDKKESLQNVISYFWVVYYGGIFFFFMLYIFFKFPSGVISL